MIDPVLLFQSVEKVSYSNIFQESMLSVLWLALFIGVGLSLATFFGFKFIESRSELSDQLKVWKTRFFVFSVGIVYLCVVALITSIVVSGTVSIIPGEVVEQSLAEQPSPEHIEITDINSRSFSYDEVSDNVNFVMVHYAGGSYRVTGYNSPYDVDFTKQIYDVTVHNYQGEVIGKGEVYLEESRKNLSFKEKLWYGLNRGWIILVMAGAVLTLFAWVAGRLKEEELADKK